MSEEPVERFEIRVIGVAMLGMATVIHWYDPSQPGIDAFWWLAFGWATAEIMPLIDAVIKVFWAWAIRDE